MISRKAHRCLLAFPSNEKDNNKLGSQLVVILGCFALVVEDDNECPSSLSFSALFF
jgi:hypothetical protein